MTIETLLGKSADELDAISKEELEKYFSVFYHITRPEHAAVAAPATKAMNKMKQQNPVGALLAKAFLEAQGIKI